MEKRIKKLLVTLLATILIATSTLTSYANTKDTDNYSNEDINIVLEESYDSINDVASIEFTIEDIDGDTIVDRVSLADDTELVPFINPLTQKVSYKYHVEENQTTRFNVEYSKLKEIPEIENLEDVETALLESESSEETLEFEHQIIEKQVIENRSHSFFVTTTSIGSHDEAITIDEEPIENEVTDDRVDVQPLNEEDDDFSDVQEETPPNESETEVIDDHDDDELNVMEPNDTDGDELVAIPRTIVKQAGVTLEIPTYDGVGWLRGDIKAVNVEVDYKDVTSTGKKLDIIIPEGMRIESISINNKSNTEGVDPRIIAQYDTSDPLYTGITNMIVPKRETAAMGATYGKISYDIAPGVRKITITLNISVDLARYYGPHTIPNPISARASMNHDTGGVSGEANQIVHGIGRPLHNATDFGNRLPGTTRSIRSTDTQTSYGTTFENYLRTYNNSFPSHILSVYAKEVLYTGYYPKGTKLSGIMRFPAYQLVSNDESLGKAVYKGQNLWGHEIILHLRYSVPKDAPLGILRNHDDDSVEVTWYDGTKATYKNNRPARYSVQIVDKVKNQLEVTAVQNLSVDTNENYQMYGPTMRVINNQGGVIENQTFTVEIQPQLQVTRVLFPFDRSIAGNKIENVFYQTNLNSTYREYKGAFRHDTTTISSLSKEQLKLAEGEFITGLSAKVGKFNAAYASSPLSHVSERIMVYGALKGTRAEVVYSLFDADNKADTLISRKLIVAHSNSKLIASGSSATLSTHSVTAGQKFTVSSQLRLNPREYSQYTAHVLSNPEIYIREVNGFQINLDSLTILDETGKTVTWDFVEKINPAGEKVYIIKTIDAMIGLGQGTGSQNIIRFLNLKYEVATSVSMYGTYSVNDFMSFGKPGFTPRHVWQNPVRENIHDMNGSGNVKDLMMYISENKISIQANRNVLVEIFLSLKGEEPKGAYVEGDENTVSYFTPGTEADFTMIFTNNGDVPTTAMSTYVPVPKTGADFGAKFQKEPFKWDMTLTRPITPPRGFRVEYSTDATGSNYNTTAKFSTTVPAQLSNVKMVKIVAEDPLQPKDVVRVLVPIRVSETFDSATQGKKIGTRNVFNPVYFVSSSIFTGELGGTLAGTELVIAEVGGFVFNDVNGDGLYRAEDGDTLVKNHTVELLKMNPATNAYEPVIVDGKAVSVKTDDKGSYNFDHNHTVSYGTYGVRFAHREGEGYQFTFKNGTNPALNSNPEVSGVNKGRVHLIDPTVPLAKTVNAGFLKYDTNKDLTVAINLPITSVKVGDTLRASSTISPTYFANIKAESGAYVWEILGNSTEKAKATLTNNNDGTVMITPAPLAKGTTTFQMTLKVTDIYGGVKTSAPVRVTIISNTLPVITVQDKSVYVTDTADFRSTLSAVDNNGQAIVLVYEGSGKNTEITHNIPLTGNKFTTAGTYAVSYKIKDVHGNEASKVSKIRVSTLPVLTATPQAYTIGEPSIVSAIAANPRATWLKASETVGAPAVSTPIAGPAVPVAANNKISYVINGPSTNFTKKGIYKVVYTATNPDGRKQSISVNVSVSDKDQVLDATKTIGISAKSFVLENAEAKNLNLASLLNANHADAFASFAVKNASGTVTDYLDVTNKISVQANQLKAINQASLRGGIFDLELTVSHDGKSIKKTIKVTVKGSAIALDHGIALATHDFSISNERAKDLTEALVLNVQHSNSSAVRISDGVSVTTLKANQGQLNAIKAAPTTGGIYLLEISASDAGRTVSRTIRVTVLGTSVVVGEGITLAAYDFTISNANAKNLTEVLALNANHTNATAILNADGSSITPLKVDALQLASIKSVTVRGGIFDLSVSASSGGETVSRTVKVVVQGTAVASENGITLAAYDFTVSNISASGLTSASALSASGANAILNADGSKITNLKVDPTQLNTIRNVGVEGGIFDLKVTATADSQSANKTIKVIVRGSSVVVQNDISLFANNFTLENSAAKNLTEALVLNANHSNASAVSNIDGSKVTDIKVDPSQLAQIRAASPSGGIYDLQITATKEGKSALKLVRVSVKGSSMVIDNDISLFANGFVIENANAKNLSETLVKNASHANVRAVSTRDGSLITDIKVDSGQLNAIKATSVNGGIYNLKITASHNGKSAVRTVKVTVNGTSVTIENGISLAGYDFTLENASAKNLTEAIALNVNHANASAFWIDDGTVITNLSVDSTQLNAIKNASAQGGIYKLRISATHNGKSAHRIVNVTVKGSSVVVENGITLAASSFVIENAAAKTLTDALIKNQNHANVSAILNADGSPVSNITIDALQLGAIRASTSLGGIYDLTITAGQGSARVSKVIKVSVKGTAVVVDQGMSLSAQDFTLNLTQAKALNEALALSASNAKAISNRDGAVINTLKANVGHINAIKGSRTGGIYDLEISATKDGKSISRTVRVTVQGSSVVVDNGISLTASNVTIEQSAARGLTDSLILSASHANARAILNLDGSVIHDIKVDQDQLAIIRNATTQGGIYDLVISAHHGGKSVSKTIKVSVKGSSLIADDTITLVAYDFVIEHADARNLNDASVKTRAGVRAVNNLDGTLITDITIDGAQLELITQATSTGGIYPLKISANAAGKSLSRVIHVSVKGSSVVIENGISLVAYDFVLENNQAKSLSQNKALELAQALAIFNLDGSIIRDLSVDESQLNSIKAVDSSGGIFDLKMSARASGKTASRTVRVRVRGSSLVDQNGISLYANHFIIDNASAKNLSETIALNASHANARAISNVDGKNIADLRVDAGQLEIIRNSTSQGGIYDLRIQAHHEGKTASRVVRVVVRGSALAIENGISLRAHDFGISNVAAKSLTEAIALNTQHANALAIVNVDGSIVSDLSVDPSELNAIKAVGTEGGIYDLTISAKHAGKSVKRIVKVSVEGTSFVSQNGINLVAYDFTLDHKDAKDLTQERALSPQYGNVSAFWIEDGTSIDDLKVDTHQLHAIQSASAQGGIFKLTIRASHNGKTATKQINVTVKGSSVVVENGLTLAARDFIIENSDAKDLTETRVRDVNHAHVSAILNRDGSEVSDIRVDATQLKAINNAPSQGGIYELRITAVHETLSLSKTVKVVVKGSSVLINEGITLAAYDFTVNQVDAKNLNNALVLEHSKATAMLNADGSIVSNVTVNNTQLSAIKASTSGGIYSLEITATHGKESVKRSIKVIVLGNSISINDGLTLSASSFTIDNEAAKLLSDSIVKDAFHANVSAIQNSDGSLITDIVVDAAQLKKINEVGPQGGIFDLSITARKDLLQVTRVIKVSVKGSAVVSDQGITLAAHDFVIDHDVAKNLNDVTAKNANHANVSAINDRDGTLVTDITVDAKQLAVINEVGSAGGIFDLSFTANHEGKTVSRTVRVSVTGSGLVSENGITLVAYDFILENAQASLLSDTLVLDVNHANPRAILTLDGREIKDFNVDAGQLSSIQKTTSKGGLYDLKITAVHGTKQVSKTIKVTVKGTSIIDEFGISLAAYDFVIDNADAKKLTEAKVLDANHAAVSAFVSVGGAKISDLSVDGKQLEAIQSATSEGGIYDLKVQAHHKGKTATKVVKVTVRGTSVVTQNGITLAAYDFTLENAQAQGLDITAALSRSRTQAFTVLDGASIDNLSVDPDQLLSIQNASTEGGVFDLQIIATHLDVVAVKTVRVSVKGTAVVNDNGITLVAYDFSIENKDAKVLEASTVLDHMHANARAIVNVDGRIINDISVNSEQLQAIQNASTEGGIFDLEISAHHDKLVAKRTIRVTVKGASLVVDQGISLVSYDFVLENSEANSLTPNDVLLKSATRAILNVDGSEIKDLFVDETQLKAIHEASTRGGIYDLLITARHDANFVSKTIRVSVKGSSLVNENGITLVANDFVLENEDAAQLDLEQVLVLSKAMAILNVDGTLIDDLKVNESQLDAIVKAPSMGGIYDLSIRAERGDLRAVKVIRVSVKGTSFVSDQGISLIAYDFTLDNAEAKTLSEERVLTLTRARAILNRDGLDIDDLSVDASQLETIKNAPTTGGIYDLRITARHNSSTASKLVRVRVKGTSVVIDESLTLAAYDFTLDHGDALVLDELGALQRSKAKALLNRDGSYVSDLSVDADELALINAAPTMGGIYDLSVKAQHEGKTISKTVRVIVKGTSLVIDQGISLVAYDFTIENESAKDLSEARVLDIDHANVRAILNVDGQVIENLKVNSIQLEAINQASTRGGIYDLEIVAEHEGNTASKTIRVFVKGTSLVVDAGMSLVSYDFVLEEDEARDLSESDALLKSQTRAVLNIDGSVVSQISVNKDQLKAINEAPTTGGIYDLEVSAHHTDKNVSKTIRVIVKGTALVIEDGITLVANDFTIENTQARSLDSETVLSLARVRAILNRDGSLITDLEVNADDLANVNAIGIHGGIVTLTIAANYEQSRASTVINVIVRGTSLVVDKGMTLVAYDLILEHADAIDISQVRILEEARAHAILNRDGSIISDLSVDLDQLKEIQSAPTHGGIYDLKISAHYDGDTLTKTIRVVVKGTSLVIDQGISLVAHDFKLENSAARNLNEALSLEYAHVKAILNSDGSRIQDLSVNLEQLKAIQTSDSRGGIYDLEVRAHHQGATVTRTIRVRVAGTSLVDDKGITLVAYDFTLAHAEAQELDEATALSKAFASAIVNVDGSRIDLLSVNSSDLEMIQNADSRGGIFALAITANHNDVSVTRIVKVTVLGSAVVVDKGITLVAYDFVIENVEAAGLSEADALNENHANASAILNRDGSSIQEISVNAEDLKRINQSTTLGGIYTLRIVAQVDEVRVERIVTVVVRGSSLVSQNGINLVAYDFTLENQEAQTLEELEVLKRSQALATLLINGNKLENLSVDANQIQAIQRSGSQGGIYDLKISAQEGELVAQRTIKVRVKGTSLVVDELMSFIAYNFVLENETARRLDELGALNYSDARAITNLDGSNVSDLRVDGAQLALINAVGDKGGIYDLSISARHGGYAISRSVKVIVKGSALIVENDIALMADDFILENKHASTLDETSALELAQVFSIFVHDGVEIKNLKVNQQHLNAIQAAGAHGEVFNLTFTATHNGHSASKRVKVQVLRATLYFIEAENVEIDISLLRDSINNGSIESELLRLSKAKAWSDDERAGISELSPFIHNLDDLKGFVLRDNLKVNDGLDLKLFGSDVENAKLSDALAQTSMRLTIRDPKGILDVKTDSSTDSKLNQSQGGGSPNDSGRGRLPFTGMGSNFVVIVSGFLVLLLGAILLMLRKNRQERV